MALHVLLGPWHTTSWPNTGQAQGKPLAAGHYPGPPWGIIPPCIPGRNMASWTGPGKGWEGGPPKCVGRPFNVIWSMQHEYLSFQSLKKSSWLAAVNCMGWLEFGLTWVWVWAHWAHKPAHQLKWISTRGVNLRAGSSPAVSVWPSQRHIAGGPTMQAAAKHKDGGCQTLQRTLARLCPLLFLQTRSWKNVFWFDDRIRFASWKTALGSKDTGGDGPLCWRKPMMAIRAVHPSFPLIELSGCQGDVRWHQLTGTIAGQHNPGKAQLWNHKTIEKCSISGNF